MYGQITNGPALLKLSAQAEERSMSGIQHGLTGILVEPSLTLEKSDLQNGLFPPKGRGSGRNSLKNPAGSVDHGNHKPQRKLSLNLLVPWLEKITKKHIPHGGEKW